MAWFQITDPADPRDVAAVVAAARATSPADADPGDGATRVIAIDGPSGSGKTALATGVADRLSCTVVHMDELYPGWDGLAEAVGLVTTEVLEPLSRGERAAYRTWDWDRDDWGAARTVEPGRYLVVEGCGCSVLPAGGYAALRVWVDADPAVRQARGVGRDGETYRPHWERWAAQERRAVRGGPDEGACRPRPRHDDGAGTATPMTVSGPVPAAGRVTRRSRREVVRRFRRVRERAFFIVQCGLGASASWYLAKHLLSHAAPSFAPVTAIVVLGLSYGQRVRRGVELTVGVALGILIGDAFVEVFGRGFWQIAVVVVVAMAGAAFLTSGSLLAGQAGVQAVFVTTLVPGPGQAFARWSDAVVGGVVALTLGLVVPLAPIRRPRLQAASALREVAAILRLVAAALRADDAAAAEAVLERARDSEDVLDELRAAASEGLAVVRLSPLVRRYAGDIRAVSDLVVPLDRGVRNLRVLARRAHIATDRGEPVPTAYVAMLDALADATEQVAGALTSAALVEPAREAVLAVAVRSAEFDRASGLSGEVLRAQVRSIVVDLLMVTGMDYDEASDLVPDTFDG